MKLVQSRRKSRLSTNTFNNVDFEYNGNTTELQHMIKKGTAGSSNKVQLNFQFGLRSYKSKTDCEHKNNWINAFQKLHHSSVDNAFSKPPIAKKPRKINAKLVQGDRYREANSNN
mmetsp:Transcript_10248/g.9052  ORF Transcript_10248/g.9052 Transcript_10248/m.9052 type:complete len:115 (-) Transcript_10248:174-518(-)